MQVPPCVLIVEDEFFIALDLEDTMSALGFHVAGLAPTPARAKSLAQSEAPDLVLAERESGTAGVERLVVGGETGAERPPRLLRFPVPRPDPRRDAAPGAARYRARVGAHRASRNRHHQRARPQLAARSIDGHRLGQRSEARVEREHRKASLARSFEISPKRPLNLLRRGLRLHLLRSLPGGIDVSGRVRVRVEVPVQTGRIVDLAEEAVLAGESSDFRVEEAGKDRLGRSSVATEPRKADAFRLLAAAHQCVSPAREVSTPDASFGLRTGGAG